MLLGDFGAEVIKVEEPGGGDELRALGPPFVGPESVFFLSVNRNKKSVAVDLKDAEARAKIRALARSVDVVVENFRPGVMTRLGLDDATLRRENPRLVYCSISAFHARTRLGDRPGYDLMISGLSGLQSMTGEPGRAPLRPGVNLVDLTAGTNAALGILLALVERQRTGRGQTVDVSLMDSAFAILGQLAAIYLNTGAVPQRRPPADLHPQIVPYGTYLTSDHRYLNVCVPNNKFWAAFCEAIDEPSLAADPRFATNADRVERRAELIPRLAARFREGTRDHWTDRLLARGIPAGPVNTIDEVVKDGINMVVYGIMAQVSIAALFAAGFLPALVMAAGLMLQLWLQARRDPGLVVEVRPGGREALTAIRRAVVPLLMPVIIFGGILTGVFTATEAGAVAVAYGLLVGVVIYRVIDQRKMYAILLETARVSGQIMLLVGTASLFAWLLSTQRVPQSLSALVREVSTGPILFLLLANLVMLVLGAVLDGLPAMIMLVPVLLPMAMQFGVDPLHFGIVLIANIGVGLFLPPVGLGVIVAAAIGRVSVSEIAPTLLPYLATMMATVLVITFWPWLTLIVPNMFGLR
jgi:tripartite ATP-independent transporter DctM subunit